MEDEPEVIRQRMEETRTSLSEKLDALESKITGTAVGATEAVTETVETVKESVQESVAAVTGAVQDTVQSIRDTFDISRQFDRHPWLMLGGSVLLGYIGGRLLGPRGSGASLEDIRLRSGGAPMAGDASGAASASAPSYATSAASPAREQEPSVVSEALGALKGVAVGAMMGLLRDMAAEALPENLKDTVTQTINNLTDKLGGKTLPSFDLSQFKPSDNGGEADGRRHEEPVGGRDWRTGEGSHLAGMGGDRY